MAGSLNNMFDFNRSDFHNRKLLLDPITGRPF
jgi:hypothetical protein